MSVRSLVAILAIWLIPVHGQAEGNGIDDVLQYVPYGGVAILKAAGVDSSHDWPQLAATAVASWVAAAGTAYVLKHSVKEWRPDDTDRRSFPSGHTVVAFAGATSLRHEFGKVSPWLTVGGYALATLTACDRVRRKRHYWHDVVAGAAIGVCASELTYYLSERLWPGTCVQIGVGPQTIDVAVTW